VCLLNKIFMLCLPLSGYDVSVEGLCVEVHGWSGVSVDLHLGIWIIVHWFLTQIMSRSCNVVRRHNLEDQDAFLDHNEELRSHARCNVNLLRVNVIELCAVLYCTVLFYCRWVSQRCPRRCKFSAVSPQRPTCSASYHKTRNRLC